MQETKKWSKKTFNQPNERREFKSHGHLDLVSFEDGISIGQGTFEPGWKWSNDVKPIAGTESCEASHTGYCVSGSMVIRMNDGEEIFIKAGDAFQIPPGHDAWVQGDEKCVVLDFTGYENYAKKAKDTKAA
ncbi:MAG: cupin domain-containing protein [Bdellovibrionota bacterium]